MSDQNFRERCIEAGRDAMGRNDGWRWWAPRHLGKLFDLWEPMIRAQIVAQMSEEMEHWFACEALESAPGDDSRCDCLRGQAIAIVEGA